MGLELLEHVMLPQYLDGPLKAVRSICIHVSLISTAIRKTIKSSCIAVKLYLLDSKQKVWKNLNSSRLYVLM